MSDDYKVPYTEIIDIKPHSGADKLELAFVYGWQVVVQKNKYKVGDRIIYVPIDSVLPESLENHIFPPDAKVKLNSHRVRQIRLRGLASQGMLIDPKDITKFVSLKGVNLETDLKEILQIRKYEPPEKGSPQTVGKGKFRNKKSDNPAFHKYNGLSNIKWFPNLFQEGEEVVVQEKLHGCVTAKTKVRLSNGTSKTIKEIVDKKLDVKILGMDKNGSVVETKILNWFNNGELRKWYRIKTSREGAGRGNSFAQIVCTPNHKFLNQMTNEYQKADSLKIGDKVYLLRQDFNITYLQKQILIGKMLGDGSFNEKTNSMSINQSKEQESYIDYTLELLGDLAGNKTNEVLSGYGTLMSRARTTSRDEIGELFKDWKRDGKKEVPENTKLSPISLAFWYMDDGSLQHNGGQEDRATFATCAFSLESCNNLIKAMYNLGIEAQVKTYDYPRIFLTADESDKLFTLISSYIPECMQYKLPEKYRQGSNYFKSPNEKYKPELTVQTIMEIETDDHPYQRYDIETETHNYFANNILTHNSNCRAGILPYSATTWWKRLKKWLHLAPKYEKCYGSNNVEISSRMIYKGYYGEDLYGSILSKVMAFDKIRPGETIYGEVIGPGIQKNYSYGLQEHRFVLFDVKVLEADGKQKWLSPEEVESFALLRGFEYVPVLYRGPYNKEFVETLTKGVSCYNEKQKVREGIVLKARNEYDINGNKKGLKWINEEYLADGSNTDFH